MRSRTHNRKDRSRRRGKGKTTHSNGYTPYRLRESVPAAAAVSKMLEKMRNTLTLLLENSTTAGSSSVAASPVPNSLGKCCTPGAKTAGCVTDSTVHLDVRGLHQNCRRGLSSLECLIQSARRSKPGFGALDFLRHTVHELCRFLPKTVENNKL